MKATKVGLSPGKGLGVFAVESILPGEEIMTCHVITFANHNLPEGNLDAYRMGWTEEEDAIALGHINLVNHSESPNVEILDNLPAKMKIMKSIKPIKTGEELGVRYRCDVWFEKI